MHVFAHDQLKSSNQRSLHRGDVNFAVTLARVSIAREKKRAFRMHRNEKRRARHQFFVVEIAGMNPRRRARDADRKSTRLNSSHDQISYAVFCLKKKKKEQT